MRHFIPAGKIPLVTDVEIGLGINIAMPSVDGILNTHSFFLIKKRWKKWIKAPKVIKTGLARAHRACRSVAAQWNCPLTKSEITSEITSVAGYSVPNSLLNIAEMGVLFILMISCGIRKLLSCSSTFFPHTANPKSTLGYPNSSIFSLFPLSWAASLSASCCSFFIIGKIGMESKGRAIISLAIWTLHQLLFRASDLQFNPKRKFSFSPVCPWKPLWCPPSFVGCCKNQGEEKEVVTALLNSKS